MSDPILAVDNWLSNQAMARKLRVLFALGAAMLVLLSSLMLAGVASWWQGRKSAQAVAALQADINAQVNAASVALSRRLELLARDIALAQGLASDAPVASLQRALDGQDLPGDAIIFMQKDGGQSFVVRGGKTVEVNVDQGLAWLGSQVLWMKAGEALVLGARVPVFQQLPSQRVRVGYVALLLPQPAVGIEQLAARRGFSALWLGSESRPADKLSAAARAAVWRSEAPVLGAQADQPLTLNVFGKGREAVEGAVLGVPTGEGPEAFRLLLQHEGGWLGDGQGVLLIALLALLSACALAAMPVSGLARRYVLDPVERLAEALRGESSPRAAFVGAGQAEAGNELERLRSLAQRLLQDVRTNQRDNSLWRQVFERAREPICIMDAAGRAVAANAAFLTFSGATLAELIGCVPHCFADTTTDAAQIEAMWRGLHDEGAWTGELRHARDEGRQATCDVSLFAIRDESGAVAHIAAFCCDNSGQEEQEARIQFLAHHDTLTGLPNRNQLMERLRGALQQAERNGGLVGLLFIDLDRFKVINDTLGHAVGDELLRTVADRLSRASESGELVARSGGDEFVIMINRLREPADAQRAAEHILALMAPTARVAGHELAITPSIGIAVYPDHGIDAEELMRNADVAMYYAKSQGRNNCQMFSAKMAELAEESLSLEHALRTAADRDEFILYYQPQIEMATRKLVGVEALIRWNSREFGMVPPGKFIRIAEECGLILQMGDWVLREACRQRAEWNLAGVADFPVAVNVSALQFRQPEFIRRVEEALQIYGIATSQLELELTESIVMHESGATAAALHRLRDMGVALSIDDFGTGYSSLGYLKHLPIQKLKVDGAFVRGIETDRADRAIVEAIVSLGRALDLTLVAEGVEQRSTITVLSKLGCHVAQGYYYCRPLPADEFVTWYKQFNGDGRRLSVV